MSKLKGFIGYLYRHHVIRYLFVGGSTFLIDFGLLVLLHGHFKFNLQLATSLSYWVSVTYNFTLNRNWTFSSGENKKLHQHLATSAVLLACNYAFTVIFVSMASHYVAYTVAKTLAVILQTSWTYQIYKKIIFNSPGPAIESIVE